jgi:hypothetical protein
VSKLYPKYGALFFSIMAMFTMLFDIGYTQEPHTSNILNYAYLVFLLGIIVFIPIKYIFDLKNIPKPRIWIVELVFWFVYNFLLVTIPFSELSNGAGNDKLWLFLAFSISLIRELSGLHLSWRFKNVNPAAIFILSFALLMHCSLQQVRFV